MRRWDGEVNDPASIGYVFDGYSVIHTPKKPSQRAGRRSKPNSAVNR